ncbi:MAG TPA: CBS domain-containing protein, partial [Spirochaetota bacterium]|nr:CBS domain-containing protein [Spirochaetota bacterium]
YKNNFSYAPVVDNNDNIIGEITMFDILKVGMSDYALTIGNIGFLSTLNPMYESLKDKDNIKIKDIMQKVNIFVEKDSSITEISLKMIHNTKRQIPVIEDKKNSWNYQLYGYFKKNN